MNNLNSVILHGNLTRDPELRFTQQAVEICDFSIAVNQSWKDKKTGEAREEVSYIDIVAFKGTATVCAEHLKKGRPVLVKGRLKQERWQDQNQQNRSKVVVHAESVHFLGPKPNGPGEKAKDQPPAGASDPEPEPPF
jgi:single-strand DNA-binding protein